MQSSRYIILPGNGFRSEVLTAGRLQTRGQFEVARPGSNTLATIRILDQISPDGPKLVEMTSDGEIALMREYAGDIRVIPVHYYSRPRPNIRELKSADSEPDDGHLDVPWDIFISARDDSRALPDATVVAFTDFRNGEGAKAQTNASGVATLRLPASTKVERLYVFPPTGYWGSLTHSTVVGAPLEVALAPIDLSDPDLALTRYRGDLPPEAGRSVRVGIIDTGIAPDHPNLVVAGGRNCVFDETTADPTTTDDWHDVDQHGTHVAGIIGGRTSEGCPFQGIAPAIELRAYRVFPRDGSEANTFDVMKAIDFARADGCHIINLSLGWNGADDALRGALGDAKGAGVLAVAAAGNDNHRPVLYPAAYESVLGISALGIRGSFPTGNPEDADIGPPSSIIDRNIFLAKFSNVGPQINFIAPGVGVVSTVPGGGFRSMSGTSMAAPMIVGFAAALLSADPFRLTMEPYERLRDLTKMLYAACVTLGFQRDFEGAGLPLPQGGWRSSMASPIA